MAEKPTAKNCSASAQTAVSVLCCECFGKSSPAQVGRMRGIKADIGGRRAQRKQARRRAGQACGQGGAGWVTAETLHQPLYSLPRE